MTEESYKYILSRLLERAFESIEEAEENKNAFDDGRKLAYYEIADIIKTKLDVRDATLEEYGLDADLEKLFLVKNKRGLNMFSYTISKEPSNALFLKVCEAIENNILGLIKDELLVDVDGSLYQTYHSPKGIIKVNNDFYVYALYVDSDIDLTKIIEQIYD